ncbi:hypothetical protein KAR34_01020 [bacterium]|nr:hypothetical protein [bacterium]
MVNRMQLIILVLSCLLLSPGFIFAEEKTEAKLDGVRLIEKPTTYVCQTDKTTSIEKQISDQVGL